MGMFKAAKTVATAKPAKAEKLQVALPGLEQLAKINALMEALGGIQATLAAQCKEVGLDVLITEGNKIEKRPENFRGTDGIASASVELRKRASTSPLTPEQVALVELHGMKPFKQITTNKMYGINPVFAEDEKLLEAVEKALDGIVPDGFIVVQEEKSKMIVTDEMLDAAFKKGIPREVVETVSVMALKPKLDTTDINAILAEVSVLIANNDEQVLTEDAAA